MLLGFLTAAIVSAVEPATGCRWVGKVIICPDEIAGTFNPVPNPPPEPGSSGGVGGTRFKIAEGTIVSDPKDCPNGTEVILPNPSGTFTCFSDSQLRAQTIEPPPSNPAPKTTVSGGGNG